MLADGFELGPRRPQLRGDDGCPDPSDVEKIRHPESAAQYTERCMLVRWPPCRPCRSRLAPTPVEELDRFRAAARRRAAPARQARRCDRVCVRRQQGPEDAARRGRGACAGCRHADHGGGVQSNHARVTAAAAAKLGLRCILVVNGAPPDRRPGMRCSTSCSGRRGPLRRDASERAPAMEAAADELRRVGRTPVRHSARRFHAARRGGIRARGRSSCSSRSIRPTSSSIPRRRAARRRVSSPAARLRAADPRHRHQRRRAGGVARERRAQDPRRASDRCSASTPARFADARVEVDDRLRRRRLRRADRRSRAKRSSSARGTEALFLDPTYTAKAMAGLIARVRARVLLGRRHGAVLAHRRPGGALRMIGRLMADDVKRDIPRRGADGHRLEVPARHRPSRRSSSMPGCSRA